MLSAYELSNGTLPVLVKQAQTLADRLTSAWFNVRKGILHPELILALTDLRRETAFPTAALKSTGMAGISTTLIDLFGLFHAVVRMW